MQPQAHLVMLPKPKALITCLSLCLGICIGQSTWANSQAEEDKEAALKRRLIPNPTVHLLPNDQLPNNPSSELSQTAVSEPVENIQTNTQPATDNAPCFNIHTIAFHPIEAQHAKLTVFNEALSVFSGSPKTVTKFLAAHDISHCMNIDDINKVARLAQNRLIDQGFVTTRIVIGNQNLKSGTLVLTLIPGMVDQVRYDTQNIKTNIYHRQQKHLNTTTPLPANFSAALPLTSGTVLNVRQLETALENFKRVPSAEASFELLPSQSGIMGGSDILINYQQNRRLRTSLYLDDSGAESTGKYNSSISLSLDNPANLNDLLYISYGYSFDGINKKPSQLDKQNSHSYSLGYVLPIDYTTLNISANRYQYDQTVVGAHQDYTYSGQSQNVNANAAYLAHRDGKSKTYLTLGGFHKAQKSFVDDTEIDVQKRKTSGWTTGIKHEITQGNNKLSIDLNYQRGTGAFNAITPPEKLFNEGDSRVGIIKLNADLYRPFTLYQQPFVYDARLKGQYAKAALVPSERISIGGRHSVRGFDGERTLSGDHGILLQQNLNLPLTSIFNQHKLTGHQLYLGFDVGAVKMQQAKQDALLLGHHLMGAAIGLKGQFSKQNKPHHNMHYDIFASHPVYTPKGFFGKDTHGNNKTGQWVYGFSVGVGF